MILQPVVVSFTAETGKYPPGPNNIDVNPVSQQLSCRLGKRTEPFHLDSGSFEVTKHFVQLHVHQEK